MQFGGDGDVAWFEGNFADNEAGKVRRPGPDSVNPKKVTFKRLER